MRFSMFRARLAPDSRMSLAGKNMQQLRKSLYTLVSLSLLSACDPAQEEMDAYEADELQGDTSSFAAEPVAVQEGERLVDELEEVEEDAGETEAPLAEGVDIQHRRDERARDMIRRVPDRFCMHSGSRAMHEPGVEGAFRVPDDCDSPGGGGGGGHDRPPKETKPSRAPSVPDKISYPRYSNGSSITVSWKRSSGYGFPVDYELYQRKGSGSWQKIYSGRSSSLRIAKLPKGKYTFKVRAKNSRYSSSYRQGELFVSNPRKEYNLYAKYPVLATLDQRTKAYRTSANTIRTHEKRALVPGQASADTIKNGRLFLGDGYDVIRGAIKETCLDVEHPDFKLSKMPPVLESTFDITYVNNNNHLAQMLDIKDTAKVGITFDDVKLGTNGLKSLFSKSVTDESHIRFVIRVKNRREFWNLSTPIDALYPELVSQVLVPGDVHAQRDFRERCGDKFINNAHLGSALYVVLDLDSKKFERESKKSLQAKIEGKLFKALKLDAGRDSKEELKQVLNEFKVQVSAKQLGGPEGLDIKTDRNNVIETVKIFRTNNDRSNWAAVDFDTSLYQRPRAYKDHPHEDIFANFSGAQGPYSQMMRWGDLSVQVQARCRPWSEYDQVEPNDCGIALMEMGIAMDQCRETSDWEHCVHPRKYRVEGAGALGKGTPLFEWLSDEIEALVPDSVTRNFNHHVHKGSKPVNDYTCLPEPTCFPDTRVNRGAGFIYRQQEWDNPRGSSNHIWIAADRKHCVKASAFLETYKTFGDTTADWRYAIDLFGICPRRRELSMLP